MGCCLSDKNHSWYTLGMTSSTVKLVYQCEQANTKDMQTLSTNTIYNTKPRAVMVFVITDVLSAHNYDSI